MSFTKVKIYNTALSALLISREITDVETNTSNDVKNLNIYWDIALESTLQDLDLDSTSQPITLELIEELTDEPWQYAYKYPAKCVFLRRLKSLVPTDTKSTHISKRTGQYNNQKAIFTDEYQAIAECIPKDVPLETLSAMAGLAVAYKLAFLAAPLVVGKGAKTLRKEIKQDYVIAKLEAQETDANENFVYETEWQRSEFVEARLS